MKIKKLSDDEFYSFFPTLFAEHFKDSMNFSIMNVRSQSELDQAERLKQHMKAGDALHFAVYDDNDKLMGWSTSRQMRMYELYTMNSVILPEFRRKGLYSMLVKETVKEARALGYQMVTSNHVISNNAVIIAKLKLGFNISGIEVFDDFGMTVKLTCHLNETRKKAFDFRTGLTRPDDEIRKLMQL